MLIEELIEKAFSDGYEYAQKEFTGRTKLINKLKKSAYEINQGLRTNDSMLMKKPEYVFSVGGRVNKVNSTKIAEAAKSRYRVSNRDVNKDASRLHESINRKGILAGNEASRIKLEPRWSNKRQQHQYGSKKLRKEQSNYDHNNFSTLTLSHGDLKKIMKQGR